MAGRNYNKIFKGNDEEKVKKVKKVEAKKETPKIEEPKKNTPKKQIIATVISRGKLNVREEASQDSSIISVIVPGTQLVIDDVQDGWAQIHSDSGLKGYVMKEFIKEV